MPLQLGLAKKPQQEIRVLSEFRPGQSFAIQVKEAASTIHAKLASHYEEELSAARRAQGVDEGVEEDLGDCKAARRMGIAKSEEVSAVRLELAKDQSLYSPEMVKGALMDLLGSTRVDERSDLLTEAMHDMQGLCTKECHLGKRLKEDDLSASKAVSEFDAQLRDIHHKAELTDLKSSSVLSNLLTVGEQMVRRLEAAYEERDRLKRRAEENAALLKDADRQKRLDERRHEAHGLREKLAYEQANPPDAMVPRRVTDLERLIGEISDEVTTLMASLEEHRVRIKVLQAALRVVETGHTGPFIDEAVLETIEEISGQVRHTLVVPILVQHDKENPVDTLNESGVIKLELKRRELQDKITVLEQEIVQLDTHAIHEHKVKEALFKLCSKAAALVVHPRPCPPIETVEAAGKMHQMFIDEFRRLQTELDPMINRLPRYRALLRNAGKSLDVMMAQRGELLTHISEMKEAYIQACLHENTIPEETDLFVLKEMGVEPTNKEARWRALIASWDDVEEMVCTGSDLLSERGQFVSSLVLRLAMATDKLQGAAAQSQIACKELCVNAHPSPSALSHEWLELLEGDEEDLPETVMREDATYLVQQLANHLQVAQSKSEQTRSTRMTMREGLSADYLKRILAEAKGPKSPTGSKRLSDTRESFGQRPKPGPKADNSQLRRAELRRTVQFAAAEDSFNTEGTRAVQFNFADVSDNGSSCEEDEGETVQKPDEEDKKPAPDPKPGGDDSSESGLSDDDEKQTEEPVEEEEVLAVKSKKKMKRFSKKLACLDALPSAGSRRSMMRKSRLGLPSSESECSSPGIRSAPVSPLSRQGRPSLRVLLKDTEGTGSGSLSSSPKRGTGWAKAARAATRLRTMFALTGKRSFSGPAAGDASQLKDQDGSSLVNDDEKAAGVPAAGAWDAGTAEGGGQQADAGGGKDGEAAPDAALAEAEGTEAAFDMVKQRSLQEEDKHRRLSGIVFEREQLSKSGHPHACSVLQMRRRGKELMAEVGVAVARCKLIEERMGGNPLDPSSTAKLPSTEEEQKEVKARLKHLISNQVQWWRSRQSFVHVPDAPRPSLTMRRTTSLTYNNLKSQIRASTEQNTGETAEEVPSSGNAPKLVP